MNEEIDSEIVVNKYWMYDGEPFHIIRYKSNGKKYVCGLHLMFLSLVAFHQKSSLRVEYIIFH